MKVRIQETEFRGNITNTNLFMTSPSTTLGLSTFYWIIIGAVSVAAILFAVIFSACGYKVFSTGKDLTSSGAPEGRQTFIKNNTNLGASNLRDVKTNTC